MLIFLSKLIIKLMNKYPKLKEEITNYIKLDIENNKENIMQHSLEKTDDTKNIDHISQEKIMAFKSVRPGDLVIAKTPYFKSDDESHLYRPFFIVGRSKKKLYGLYGSTSPNTLKQDYYYHYFDKVSGKVSNFNCKKIYILDKEGFKNNASSLDDSAGRKIVELLASNAIINTDMIDFNAFGFEPKIGSVVLFKNEFYLLYNCTNDGSFYAYKLVCNPKHNDGIRISNTGYMINVRESIIINKNEMDCVILENACTKSQIKTIEGRKGVKRKDYSNNKYNFGDVLSLKNSKEKIIYLNKENDKLYYITEDQLDFFTGIKKISVQNVNSFYRKLSNEELSRVFSVLDKPLNSCDTKYVSSSVKSNILNSVKQLKK